MKKKTLACIITLVAVVCIAVGAFLLFNKETMTGTKALEMAMGNLSSDVRSVRDNFSPTNRLAFDKTKKYNVVMNLKTEGTDADSDLNLDMYYDSTNNLALLNEEGVADGESGKASLYFENNKLYYKKGDASQYLYIDLNEAGELEGLDLPIDFDSLDQLLDPNYSLLDNEQIKTIKKYLKKAILDNVKDDDFKEETKDLTLGGAKHSAKKYTLKVTQKMFKNILVSFLENIKKDKELVKNIGEGFFNDLMNAITNVELDDTDFAALPMANETTDEVNNFEIVLDQLIDALKSEEATNDKIFDFIMYVEDEDLIRYEISVTSDEQTFGIIFSNYENKSGFNNKEMSLVSSGSELLSLKILGTSKTSSSIEVIAMGTSLITGTSTKTDTKYEVKLSTGELEGNKLDFNYTNEYDKNTKEEKINFSMSVSTESEEGTENYEMTAEATAKEIDEMPKVDVSNSVPGRIEDLQ